MQKGLKRSELRTKKGHDFFSEENQSYCCYQNIRNHHEVDNSGIEALTDTFINILRCAFCCSLAHGTLSQRDGMQAGT